MKQDHYLFTEKTDWNAAGHKAVQRLYWFASGFMLAYLTWGQK